MHVWINLLSFVVQRLVAPDLWRALEGLVEQADADAARKGEEKREHVLGQLLSLPDPVRSALGTTASWLLNLALEAAVARLRVRGAGDGD